jgi:hypothetical protein
VPRSCQNGWKTVVTIGYLRTPRKLSDLEFVQVDALPETTCDETACLPGHCVESSQVSSAGPTRAMPL